MTSVMRIARWLRGRRATRRRSNPYLVGTPVFDGSLLFGREQLTARVLALLASRSVRLTGEHRIGKTSFLHHLEKALTSHVSGFVPVFVDLEAAPAAPLSRILMEETVETLALPPGTLGLQLGDRHDVYHVRDLVHDVKRVVRDLRERTRADARLVFLVDEVDAVLPDAEPGATWLDAFLEECPDELRVVLAGVNGKKDRRAGPRRERGLLEDVVLGPLHADDARALVTTPVAHCYRYEPRAVDRIVQLAQGRPYVLQKLCLNALNRMLDEGRSTVRLADVESTADLVAMELPWRSAPSAAGTAKSA